MASVSIKTGHLLTNLKTTSWWKKDYFCLFFLSFTKIEMHPASTGDGNEESVAQSACLSVNMSTTGSHNLKQWVTLPELVALNKTHFI